MVRSLSPTPAPSPLRRRSQPIDDWECTYQETYELTCNLGCGEIMRVGRAAALPDQWAVRVLLGPDDDAEEEVRFYDSLDDARAAVTAAPAAAETKE